MWLKIYSLSLFQLLYGNSSMLTHSEIIWLTNHSRWQVQNHWSERSKCQNTIESCSRSSSLLSLLLRSQVYCLLMVSWSCRRYDSQSRASLMNWKDKRFWSCLEPNDCGLWNYYTYKYILPGSKPYCLWDVALHRYKAGSPTATESEEPHCTPEDTHKYHIFNTNLKTVVLLPLKL